VNRNKIKIVTDIKEKDEEMIIILGKELSFLGQIKLLLS